MSFDSHWEDVENLFDNIDLPPDVVIVCGETYVRRPF